MAIVAIDHVILACGDPDAAAEPWRRLGLTPVPGTRHISQGTENAAVFFGDSPETMFYIEFLTIADEAVASRSTRGRKLSEAIATSGGLFRIVLETDDLEALCLALSRDRVQFRVDQIDRDDGSRICEVVTLAGEDETSLQPRFIQYAADREARFAARRERGVFAHTFELDRLDHVALAPPDLAAATKVWAGTYGLAPAGAINRKGLAIQQMQAGDTMVELLSSASPSSGPAGVSQGLLSMLACEVSELDVAVERARERGFTPSKPAKGVLPGTRTATIPAGELSGIALQLLEYE